MRRGDLSKRRAAGLMLFRLQPLTKNSGQNEKQQSGVDFQQRTDTGKFLADKRAWFVVAGWFQRDSSELMVW